MKSSKNGTGTSAFRAETARELLAGKLLLPLITMTPLNPSGHLSQSEAAVRPRPKNRRKSPPKRRAKTTATPDDTEKVRPAVGTLTRTKSLLLAALKVWELKNGIRD